MTDGTFYTQNEFIHDNNDGDNRKNKNDNNENR